MLSIASNLINISYLSTSSTIYCCHQFHKIEPCLATSYSIILLTLNVTHTQYILNTNPWNTFTRKDQGDLYQLLVLDENLCCNWWSLMILDLTFSGFPLEQWKQPWLFRVFFRDDILPMWGLFHKEISGSRKPQTTSISWSSISWKVRDPGFSFMAHLYRHFLGEPTLSVFRLQRG